jgi:hypothetical protein
LKQANADLSFFLIKTGGFTWVSKRQNDGGDGRVKWHEQ